MDSTKAKESMTTNLTPTLSPVALAHRSALKCITMKRKAGIHWWLQTWKECMGSAFTSTTCLLHKHWRVTKQFSPAALPNRCQDGLLAHEWASKPARSREACWMRVWTSQQLYLHTRDYTEQSFDAQSCAHKCSQVRNAAWSLGRWDWMVSPRGAICWAIADWSVTFLHTYVQYHTTHHTLHACICTYIYTHPLPLSRCNNRPLLPSARNVS